MSGMDLSRNGRTEPLAEVLAISEERFARLVAGRDIASVATYCLRDCVEGKISGIRCCVLGQWHNFTIEPPRHLRHCRLRDQVII